MIYNQTAIKELPTASKSTSNIEALLLEYDVNGNSEKVAWKFLINPKELAYKNSAEYSSLAPIATQTKIKQFVATEGKVLTISDMIVDVWCIGKTLQPSIDALESLLKAKVEANELSPKVLMFKWGSHTFAPCVLLSVEMRYQRLLSGEPAKAVISIALGEIPKPLTRAQKAAIEAQKQATLADRNQIAGKPRFELTDRQVDEAKTRANQYLSDNLGKFTADIQSLYRQKGYTLDVDKKTGLVTMNARNKSYGTVLKSLGSKFEAGEGITTIPKIEGLSLEVLK